MTNKMFSIAWVHIFNNVCRHVPPYL